MKLGAWMVRQGLDDEGMAERIRAAGHDCDRTMILRYRTGKRRPKWPTITVIAAVTKNAVTADDWMTLEPTAQ
jgi:hypothetical protein